LGGVKQSLERKAEDLTGEVSSGQAQKVH